ncbi:MAG: hypothetical protein AB7J35_19820 [Dehalococcoidia bacterium]
MTLALYGKSRKRRAGLLFTAFMAIMVAAIGGVSLITSAFAHTISSSSSSQCNGDWTSRLWYSQGGNGESDLRLVLLTDVKVNNTGYSTSWASGIGNLWTQATGNNRTTGNAFVAIGSYGGTTAGLPLSGTQYVWVGIDETFDIFNRNQSSGALNSNASAWSGNAVVYSYTTQDGGKWVYAGYQDSVEQPPAPTGCTTPPKLKVVKDVVTSGGGSATNGHNFDFAISPTSGVSPTSFSLDDDNNGALPNNRVITLPSGTKEYTITETQDSGWDVYDITCTDGTGIVVDKVAGTVKVTLGDGDDATCTFKNNPEPPTRKLLICKQVVDNGASPANEGGQFTFTLTGGASTTVNLTRYENSSDGIDGTLCSQSISVPEGSSVTISESGLPAGWNHAAGYPIADRFPGVETAGVTQVTVAVNNGKCDNDANGEETAAGLVKFFYQLDFDCAVIFKNKNNPTPPPSVSVDKSDNTQDGTAALGTSFNFTLNFSVTNGPTTSPYSVQDMVPANFTVGTITPGAGGSPLHCTNVGNLVDCTLDVGATSNYTATIPVTVNANSQCGAVVNDVHIDNVVEGQILDSDTVNITGCGSVTFDKKDGVIDGQNIKWDIEITNSSVVAGNITIYDPGTSLGSETCTNAVSESPADTYYCEVGGSSTAHLYLLTPLPQDYNPVCESIDVDNTASIAGNYQSSDTAEYKNAAQPDSSCFDITKDVSDIEQGQDATNTYWDIKVTNNTDAQQAVWVVDSGAKFVKVVDGYCPDISAGDDVTGTPCLINPGDTMVFTVSKAKNLEVCEDTNTNSATISLGREAGGTVLGTPTGDPINYRNEDQCSSVIQLCKVWAFNVDNELSDGDANFDFTVNGDPFTIFGVTEGDSEPECILLDVPNGGVSISEDLTAGFHALGWEIDNQAAEGLGDTVSFTLTPNGCYTLQNESVISLYVRQVLNVVGVAEIQEGDPVCTITFTNYDDQNREPSGNLRIEKYLDINGDGDSNDAGEGLLAWTVNVQGPEAGVVGDHYMAGGFIDFAGLTSGDLYTATEASQAGYTVTNATVDGVSKGAVTSTNATIPNGGTTVVRFYNQPLGGITVHKDTYNVVNNIENQNFNDDDGWKITVDSATCNIHLSKNTDANGNASFSGLPLCMDYVVKEDLNNPGAPGYSPVTPATVNGVTPTINGYTSVKFVNQTTSTDPVCTTGCTPRTTTPTTPTSTPTTPTATPETPTVAPTTPAAPSETAIAGEKTPGPGSPTPIAPSTGSGLMGGTAAGMNLLLLLGGILALASGLSFVALGRKSRS